MPMDSREIEKLIKARFPEAEVTIKDLRIHSAALLADNHSVAVVGTTDLRTKDFDPDGPTPGGAIVDPQTRAVRRFTTPFPCRD